MRPLRIALSLCLTPFALSATLFAGEEEWVHWRGPTLNGVSTETNLPSTWSKDGENLLWAAPGYGGRSAPIVMDGKVHLINRVGTGETLQERVVALDINTGKVVWEHRFNVFLTDIVEHRLGWAHVTGDPETGYLYAHGVQGLFMCFDPKGKLLWSRSLTEEFGRVSGYGGRTNSPIVEGDMVIIGSLFAGWGPLARTSHRLMAMDKRTGEVIWWSPPSGRPLDTTYSVPVVTTLNGIRTLIAGLADGSVRAYKVNTGENIWSFQLSKRGINTSVVYNDGKVYASHSEENFDTNVMGRLVCIDANGTGDITKTGELWRIDRLGAGYASPTLHDGLLYVPDNSANIHCVDAKTGEEYWTFNYGTAARGSALYADGKLYIGEVTGKFHVIEVSKEGAKHLDEEAFQLENGSPVEIFSTPTAADGKVFLATKDDLYCISKQKAGKKSKKSSKKGKKAKKAKKQKSPKAGPAAHVQVVPGETWIDTGKSQKFVAKTFDAKGNYIGEVKAEWSIAGASGTMGADGTFKSSGTKHVQAAVITAKVGDLSGNGRLRVLPQLPYFEDFEGMEEKKTPPGWMSSPVKSHVATKDGSKVLRKLAARSHPAFARMRNYMMPPLEQGYTVQSDMYGASKKRRFWPDMGLINSRYNMILMGTTRKPALRLVSWDPMPRIQKDVPFDWKPDTWYTMKMVYSIKDGKGWVRGKVWPRGGQEPEAWSIEVMDPSPNTGGSPALYAYSVAISETSPGTEVFFDNVHVTKNK